jgi:predicted permease
MHITHTENFTHHTHCEHVDTFHLISFHFISAHSSHLIHSTPLHSTPQYYLPIQNQQKTSKHPPAISFPTAYLGWAARVLSFISLFLSRDVPLYICTFFSASLLSGIFHKRRVSQKVAVMRFPTCPFLHGRCATIRNRGSLVILFIACAHSLISLVWRSGGTMYVQYLPTRPRILVSYS